jgi:hypothetical protein
LVALVLAGKDWLFFPDGESKVSVQRLPWVGVAAPTPGQSWAPPKPDADVVLRAVRLRSDGAKLTWMIAFVVQLATFVAALSFFTFRLRRGLLRAYGDEPRARRMTAVLVAVAIACGVVYYLKSRTDNWRAEQKAKEETTDWMAAPADEVASRMLQVAAWDNSRLRHGIDIQNGFTFTVVLTGLFAIGTCNLPAPPVREVSVGVRRRADLVVRRDDLRLLLTVCAVILSIGVAQIFFEFRWVAMHFWNELKPSDMDKPWELAVAACSAASFAAAAFLSLLLVCAFGSSGLLLQRDIDTFNQGTKNGAELTFSLRELAGDAAKTLGPLLTFLPLTAFLR